MISWAVPTTAQEMSASSSSRSRTIENGIFTVSGVNSIGETTGRSRTVFTSRSEQGSTSFLGNSQTRYYSSYFTSSSSATTLNITSNSATSSSSTSSATSFVSTEQSNYHTSTTTSASETFSLTTTSSGNIATASSTRSKSGLATTTLSETYAAHIRFGRQDVLATIFKAAADEVLWHMSNATADWSGFSAASAVAATTNEVTVTPFVLFEQMQAADSSAAANTFSAPASTQAITWTSTTQATTQSTLVYYNSLPNFTTTLQDTTAQTTTSSRTTLVFPSWSFTISGNTQATRKTQNTTTTQKDFGRSIALVSNQIGSSTFQETITSRTVSTKTTTVRAAQMQIIVFSTVSNLTSAGGGTWTITDESTSYFESSGDTTFGLPILSTDSTGQTFAKTFWTSGARLGSEVGLFFTANNTFEPSDPFTALDGNAALAVTLLPSAVADYTISANAITTKTGTRTEDTVAIQASVSGTPQAVEWRPQIELSKRGFGGRPIDVQTIVNKANPGVYKNAANGQSILLDGNATVYSGSASAELSKFESITNIIPHVLFSQSYSQIVWPAPRNSTQIPQEL